MENHFCHVELQTTNPAKASDLYLELFGWKVEQSQPGLGYWMIKTKNGHDIGSVKRVEKIVNTDAINYVHVEEIDATIRHSAKFGAKAIMWKTPLENPEWGNIGMFETEDGFRIGLWSKE
jgi:hypothetical protein